MNLIRDSYLHLCVDMQRMFCEETDWHLPWAARVMPNIVALCAVRPDRTIFTRFIPPETPQDRDGMWRSYFERWQSMTLQNLPAQMIDLALPLQNFAASAVSFDKAVYSPWQDGHLHKHLAQRGITHLVVSGGETDVCVLAAVLGAIDLGYKVILASDAICSCSDEAHDAALQLYHTRYSLQVDPMLTRDILPLIK